MLEDQVCTRLTLSVCLTTLLVITTLGKHLSRLSTDNGVFLGSPLQRGQNATQTSDRILNYDDPWDVTGGKPIYKVVEGPIWTPTNKSHLALSEDEINNITLSKLQQLKVRNNSGILLFDNLLFALYDAGWFTFEQQSTFPRINQRPIIREELETIALFLSGKLLKTFRRNGRTIQQAITKILRPSFENTQCQTSPKWSRNQRNEQS